MSKVEKMFCFDQNNQNEFLYFFCNIYKNIFIKVEINFCDVTKWPEICFKFDFWLLTLYYKVLSFSCLQQNIIDFVVNILHVMVEDAGGVPGLLHLLLQETVDGAVIVQTGWRGEPGSRR